MSSAFQPKGLENWLNILDEHLLPVLPAHAHKISRLVKDRDVSLHDIAEVIALDPVMRVHVVRECNRQHKDHAIGILSNTHHCVAMMGLDKIQILMRQFKAAKGDPKDPRDYHYFQAISLSLHAAEQAASWAELRNQSNHDQMFLASLLYGMPMWCLWRFAHKEMKIIHTLFQREQIPMPEAEQAVLGCTREQIAVELAQRWHFPDTIKAALLSQQLPKPSFLLRCAKAALDDPHYKIPNKTTDGKLVNTPALAITLSNSLAQETSRNWYSKQTHRCLKVIAAYLAQPLDDMEKRVKSTAITASQRWHLPGIQAPAASLIWPPQPSKRRRIKHSQLPLAVAQLSGEKKQLSSAKSPNAKLPTRSPLSSGSAATSVPASQAKTIGMRSEHLPEGLDRNSILNAPRPKAPEQPLTQHPGFVSFDKRREFEDNLKKMIQQPDYFSTEFEAIHCLVDTLYQCSNLERVIVALLDKKRNHIKAYYALGCDDSPILKNFEVKLQPSNLFTQILAKPAGVWLNPDRKSSVSALVPGSFKQACQSDEFFLMSVFNQRGAYGVFFADKGLNSTAGLSEAEYKIFKAACTTCSKHLITKAKRAAAKRSSP